MAYFDCKKFKGLKAGTTVLRSFELAELDGDAESYAAGRARAKDPDGKGITSTSEEMIRFSIRKVNGVEVTQPYEGMNKWSTRARSFLIAAYRSVNGAEDAEIGDFLAASADEDPSEAVAEVLPDYAPDDQSDDG